MKSSVIVLLLLFTSCFVSNAEQIRVTGTLINKESNQPIEFVGVALLSGDSTFVAGELTDTLGHFIFKDLKAGDYILSVDYVGYHKKYIPVENLTGSREMGNMELEAVAKSLDEITVTAQRVIQQADRKLILPSDVQIKSSSNGVNLLQNMQLPRIIVNPFTNTITVPEGGAVQLRINGMEVTMAEVLTLNPEDVIRIEYHDNPGMRYGNAPAVIDYIVRRHETGGSISADLANVLYGMGWGENVAAAKVNYKKSEFSTNAYWARRSIDWTRENKETFNFPDRTLERTEEGLPTEFKMDYLNVNLNYNLNDPDKYMFNAALRYDLQDFPKQFGDRNSIIYSSDNDIPLEISDHSSWKASMPRLDLYYQRNLKNNQLVIVNLVASYIDSKSTRLYQEKTEEATLTDIRSDISGDKYALIGEAIYEKRVETGKLSAGIKHNQSFTRNIYEGNIATDINLKFAETYAFAEYQWQRSKFNYTLGLGAMRTYNSQGESKNEKYILRPTLSVAYNINDNASIRYNGYVSGYSPSLSDLNNVEQIIDSLQIRRGNPELKTVWYYTHTLNAGYHKGIFGVDFFMRYSYDHKPTMEQITFEDGKFVRQNVNQKGFHRLYMQTSLSLKPWKDYISLSLRPGLNRYISYGNDFTHTYTNFHIQGNLLLSYKNWIFNAMANSRWNDFWGETKTVGEKIHLIMAGYNTPKWGVKIGMFNPFSKNYTQGSRNYSALLPSISDVYTDKLCRIVMVNFTMNLNFGRQYQGGSKRLSNDDTDAGIMSGSK